MQKPCDFVTDVEYKIIRLNFRSSNATDSWREDLTDFKYIIQGISGSNLKKSLKKIGVGRSNDLEIHEDDDTKLRMLQILRQNGLENVKLLGRFIEEAD